MTALLRVDGEAYRLMGSMPASLPAMKQTSMDAPPTRTIYQFSGAGVDATLTFTTPALPSDLMLLSRPTTYVTCEVQSGDAAKHEVEFYFDARGEPASDTLGQPVTGSRQDLKNSQALKIGTVSQNVLGRSADDIRIDWGYLYLAAAKSAKPTAVFGTPSSLQSGFAEGAAEGIKNEAIDFPITAGNVAAALALDLGQVGEQPVSRYVLLAYDDLYSIEYMRSKLRPYWRSKGWDASDLLTAAVNEYPSLMERCEEFDEMLMTDLENQGGKKYAEIAALAYRQCFAAGKFVADANGQPLQFCKENNSNGCIATSDVFYPMTPQFLLFGTTLTKSFLVPFMEYAASDRWPFPFAPHDLGTYPKANGQVYGGGERSAENQMPVEESGNLLILFAALAKAEENADFAGKYWEQLSQWADYLQAKGFDPENQLCTDDFAGHMAHNVNLSAKAICGLGGYAMLCEMRGKTTEAEKYRKIAQRFAQQWMAAADDGDHYRLAFDRPGTWSQKYNLVWDHLLDLNLFPEKVLEKEMAYYQKVQNEYGLPLDNRSDYTKLDRVLWSATLTENDDDFQSLVAPVYKFLNETPDRTPMTDWYYTSTGKRVGFMARPVVGAVFLKMLYDASVWSKYTSREKISASGWAPMPIPPKTKTLVPTSEESATAWHYTTARPEGDWFAVDYSADQWKEGPAGFGTPGTPSAVVRTVWDSSDIWVRRNFELDRPLPDQVGLRIHHDEDAQVYINGKQVANLSGWTTSYDLVEIPSTVLRAGKNVIAIHCQQSGGGQYIDTGLDVIEPAEAQNGSTGQ